MKKLDRKLLKKMIKAMKTENFRLVIGIERVEGKEEQPHLLDQRNGNETAEERVRK
jgi:hypothetical protein